MFRATRTAAIWMKPKPMIAPPAHPGLMGVEYRAKELGPQGPFLDPFGTSTGCEPVPQKGTGTKDDPILIASRNPCKIYGEDVSRYGLMMPKAYWWIYAEGDGVTENNMCRSTYSGRYFKLIHDPTDYYGLDIDAHSHAFSQY